MRLENVTERIGPLSEKLYDGVSCAGALANQGAQAAYRAALEHPKTSIGGFIFAAALVGGLLWYVFGREEPRRRTVRRVRASRQTAHRTRARGARAAAAH